MLHGSQFAVAVENALQHEGQGAVPGHVAGRAEAVLQGENGNEQGHAGLVKAQHAGHDAQRGHHRAAGHAGRAHGENSQQHAEKRHGAQRGQCAV